MKILDLKYKCKSTNKKNNNINKKNEKGNLKQILAPMILEIIGKKYTDVYYKKLGDEYYQYIENIINKNRFSSSSNANTKLLSDDESIVCKNNYNKKFKSTYWKDYDFVNRPSNYNNLKINKDNNSNLVEISNNNNIQTDEEEQTESFIIKNKEEDDFEDEDE